MIPDEDVIVGGKYLMGRKIGSGSFASVLLGTDIETAKYVAIKFVSFSTTTVSRKNHRYHSILNSCMKPKFSDRSTTKTR